MNRQFVMAFVMLAVLSAVASMVPSLDTRVCAGSRAYPPYFQKLEKGLFYPSYLERDSTLIAKQLGLSDSERVLVEAVIGSYVAAFQRESQIVREKLLEIESPLVLDLPDHVSRKNIRKRAKQTMYSTNTQSEGIKSAMMEKKSDRMAKTLKVISEEIELEPLDDIDDSSRTLLISEWSARRTELERNLLDELELIRSEKGGHWDAIRRALRRLNSDWAEQFRGEDTDLELLMREFFGQDDANYMNARRLLAEYAIDYDMQLAIRNAVLNETTPLLFDALDRTHIAPALSICRDQVMSRAALVDLNLVWKQRLLESVENDQRREDFEQYMNARMYPDIHLGDPPAATINYLIDLRLVDKEAEKQLLDLKDAYQQERDAWRLVSIMLKPEWERDRLIQELESNVISMAYVGWLNGLGNERKSLLGWKSHLASGRQINKDYFDQINGIIGYEAMAAVPGRFKVSRRSDGDRGPVPNASRSANVVYWDGFMDKVKK